MTEGFAYLGLPGEEPSETLLERLRQSPIIAADVETVSLKDRTVIGIGLSPNLKESFYFQVLPEPSPHLPLIWDLLRSDRLKVFHNAMFDLGALGEIFQPFADTSVMAQVQGLPANLKDLAHFYLAMEIDEIADILPARRTMLDLDFEVVAGKCLHDVLATRRLHKTMGGGKWTGSGHTWSYTPNYFYGYYADEPTSYYVSPQMKDCYQVDIALIPILLRMGWRGIALRQERVQEWYERLGQERLFYQDICTQEGFNPGSNQQVGYVLAARSNWLNFTKSKKQLKVDEEALSALGDPLARVVLEYRRRDKLLGTYLRPWLGEERAYTHYRLDVATGRLASYNRNIQNIPPPIRDVFAPDSGTWTWLDYDQIEMRVFAYITQDPVMLRAYREGSDIHAMTQSRLWPGSDLVDKAIRLRAKTFNFAMIYFAAVETLAKHTGLPLEACANYRQEWLELYPKAAEWMVRQGEEGSARKWTETIYGRRQRLPGLDRATPTHIFKCAINFPVQGSAADIVKRAMLRCGGLDMVAQVHDEILVDGQAEEALRDLLLDCLHPELPTPYKIGSGASWGLDESLRDAGGEVAAQAD